MQTILEQQATKNVDQKYCVDCGQQILRRAEICPACGCRQLPAPTGPSAFSTAGTALSRSVSDPITGPMILLLVLNFLWNGLGNLAVGDKRGWTYGFGNWVFFIISIFTFGVPCMAFYAYCGHQGHTYLKLKAARENSISEPQAV
jgi:hypothetical protein